MGAINSQVYMGAIDKIEQKKTPELNRENIILLKYGINHSTQQKCRSTTYNQQVEDQPILFQVWRKFVNTCKQDKCNQIELRNNNTAGVTAYYKYISKHKHNHNWGHPPAIPSLGVLYE